jgi:multisubunit Na+/H+ antiporter MnhE subunit
MVGTHSWFNNVINRNLRGLCFGYVVPTVVDELTNNVAGKSHMVIRLMQVMMHGTCLLKAVVRSIKVSNVAVNDAKISDGGSLT